MARVLTDTFIKAIKPAAPGRRDEHWDASKKVPGLFGVRVTDTGAKSFIIYARIPPSKSPARLTLGDARKLGLAAARDKARVWFELIEQGKDPREVARKEQQAEQRARQTT